MMLRLCFYCLAFCLLVSSGFDEASAQTSIHAAPSIERNDAGTGFIPPPMDLSHLRPSHPSPDKILSHPARFDWREEGLVSPIKNQGSCGSCYAFAAASDVESRVLDDHETLVDISENHLKECHFEERSCLGGNAFMMTNVLSLHGAVLEDCDPYEPTDVGCRTGCDHHFSVLDWIIICGNVLPATTAMKQALLDHGPLSTTVYAGDDAHPAWRTSFNNWSGDSGLHFGGANDPNHAVTLVGWDDDHPHDGGGQGCWIVKNSWGTGWGDACGFGETGGYFYIAYESANIGMWTTVFTEIMPSYPELAVLAWDEGGWTQSYGTGSTVSIWGLARFTPDAESNLHRVEFWTTDATARVDVYVYSGFDGSELSGQLASVLDRSFDAAGYHSIALDDPLPMTPDNDYYVAVYLQNDSNVFPLVTDTQGSNAAGRSWISVTGDTWFDLSVHYDCSAGIRIRTSPHDVLQLSGSEEQDLPDPPQHAGVFELGAPWPNPFNPRTSLAFTLGRTQTVRLRVFDLQGRLVSTLLEAEMSAGRHQTSWSGRDDAGRMMPAGIYHCRLDDGLRWRSQRMVLVK
jgi:C1A family cysteine protease